MKPQKIKFNPAALFILPPGRNLKISHGFTIIELVIASTILAIILMITMETYMIGYDAYDTGKTIVRAQTELQIKLDQICEELAESSSSAFTVYSWVDPALGTQMQDAICFPIARSITGTFVIGSNGTPLWQAVVLYAPYANPNTQNRGELKKYVSFGSYTFPLSITSINTTTITLSNGLTFTREQGQTVLGDAGYMDAQALNISLQDPLKIKLVVNARLPDQYIMPISLETNINCRND
ncbi:MAG: prepilin-type N-terminal cleavage/methylation domain-containing protein [Planctomycetota bacterium]